MPFDAMGNYTGGYMLTPEETEEDRRRRLGLTATTQSTTPVKQTITTDPRTGEQRMKIEGSVRDLSAANPLTPTVSTAPVSPEMLGIRQVESGNRDFDAQGLPVTSPRGAMYASQVMPATARDPGFGVRPAQAQTADEYNRVGQDYFNAMLQRYGGNREQALAAYNAGPGRVDRNLAANQGQLNVGQLPRETQGYIPRALNAISNAVFPSAQAATPPAGPTGPVAAPVSPDMALGQGLRIPTGIPMTDQGVDWDNLLAGSQTNQQVRNRMINDPNVPRMYQAAARSNEQSAVKQQQDNRKLDEQMRRIQSGDPEAWNRAIKEDGSLLKAIFFGYTGAQDLARNELNKMGYGGKWESAMDDSGNRALIKYRQDGIPMEGYDETGTKLTNEQLAAFGAMGGTGKWTTSGTFFQTPTGQILRAQNDERGRTRLVDTGTGAVYRGPTNNLMKLEEAGQYRKMDYALVTDLKKKHGTNVLEAEKEYVALNGPFRTDADRQQFRDAYGFSQAMPPTARPSTQTAPSAPAAAPAAAPVSQQTAPVGGPVAPGQQPALVANTPQLKPVINNVNVPLVDQQIAAEGKKKAAGEVATESGKEIAASASTQALIAKIDDKIIPTIDSGEHNIGSVLSGLVGRGPIAQGIGQQFETTQAKNTKEIMETVDMLAIEGLKSLGANPSTRDLEFYTRNKPTASSDPEFVKSWLASRSQALKEKLSYAEQQAGAGGRAGVAPRPDRRGAPGTKSNPIKLD